jgi:hypothetical protein
MSAPSERWARWCVPLAFACLSAPATYAIARVIQGALFPSPDPRFEAVGEGHIPYFWRILLSGYVGVMVGAASHALRRRWPERLDAALPIAVAVVTVVATLQGWFWP